MDMTKELLLQTADMICDNTFIFNHKWDMEACNVPVKFDGEIQWNKIPFEDEEWAFMLNRHKYWTFLGKAYLLTKDEKYLTTFIRQMNSWIDSVELANPEFKDCARTIEMGLRCINWIKTIELFEREYKFDEDFKEKVYNSLKEQCDILLEIYDDFRTLSNWGVLQNCGLITFAFYYGKLDTDYFTVPLKRLEHQCKIQILPDGVHWEQSPMYQNEVLNCLLETAVQFKHHNMEIPQFIRESIRKIGFSNFAMKKPNHHQPMQGDSDDTDLRDIITRCASVLEDEELKFGGFEEIDFESIWELDKKSIENYSKLQAKKPDYTSVALQNSGNFYLRDFFDEKGNYLWFTCGSIGSGHGHGDMLHFDLTYKGEDFLIDSGRYTYVEGNETRIELKNNYSHNTIIMDNQLFSKFNGSWGIGKTPLPLNSMYKFDDKFDYVEGGHLGYLDQPIPAVSNRKIFYIKPDLWVVVDEFLTRGEHSYKQFFNLDSDVKAELEENHAILKKENTLHMKWSDNVKLSRKDIQISKEYNTLQKSTRIESETSFVENAILFTVISPENLEVEKIQVRRGNLDLVGEDEAKAIRVKISEDREIIFFNSTREVAAQKKTYLLDGVLFYGKTGFIDINKGEKELHIFKY